MSFVSIQFLVLLVVTFCIYQMVEKPNLQNIVLLLSSIVFYGWFDWRFLGLLLGTVVFSYWSAIQIEHSREENKKIWMILSAVVHLGVLCAFKYFNFFQDATVQFLSGFGFNQINASVKVIWPIGLSFYILQSLGYVIDVYRGKIPSEKNFIDYCTFICFFAQLVAGPIERSKDLLPQLKKSRSVTPQQIEVGILIMLVGYVFKMLVSDSMAVLSSETFATPGAQTGWKTMTGLYAFSFQLYCDFAGYSLIALGLGKLFGIELARNFQRPFLAGSPIEFWRRWHISMGRFLKDYVLIPLHRLFSKRFESKKSASISFMLMHMINGVWHGTGWNFLVWGTLHGMVASTQHSLSSTRIGRAAQNLSSHKLYRFFSIFLTYHIWVVVGVVFVMRNMEEVKIAFLSLLKPTNKPIALPITELLLYAGVLLVMEVLWEKRKEKLIPAFTNKASIRRIAIFVLYLFVVFGAYQESREFAYFRY